MGILDNLTGFMEDPSRRLMMSMGAGLLSRNRQGLGAGLEAGLGHYAQLTQANAFSQDRKERQTDRAAARARQAQMDQYTSQLADMHPPGSPKNVASRVSPDMAAKSFFDKPEVDKPFGGGLEGMAAGVYLRLGNAVATGAATPDQTREFEAAKAILGQPQVKINPDGSIATIAPLLSRMPTFGQTTGINTGAPRQGGGQPQGGPAAQASSYGGRPSGNTHPAPGVTVTPPTKPPKYTEGETKAAALIPVAYDAEKNVEEILKSFEPGFRDFVVGAIVPEQLENLARSEEGQKYKQAMQQWVNAINRMESGASISLTEMSEAETTYFPVYGDSEGVRKQKNAARKAKLESVKKAYQNVFPDGGPSLGGDLPQTAKELGVTDAEWNAMTPKQKEAFQ